MTGWNPLKKRFRSWPGSVQKPRIGQRLEVPAGLEVEEQEEDRKAGRDERRHCEEAPVGPAEHQGAHRQPDAVEVEDVGRPEGGEREAADEQPCRSLPQRIPRGDEALRLAGGHRPARPEGHADSGEDHERRRRPSLEESGGETHPAAAAPVPGPPLGAGHHDPEVHDHHPEDGDGPGEVVALDPTR